MADAPVGGGGLIQPLAQCHRDLLDAARKDCVMVTRPKPAANRENGLESRRPRWPGDRVVYLEFGPGVERPRKRANARNSNANSSRKCERRSAGITAVEFRRVLLWIRRSRSKRWHNRRGRARGQRIGLPVRPRCDTLLGHTTTCPARPAAPGVIGYLEGRSNLVGSDRSKSGLPIPPI